jgi:hypothetical protein
MTQPPAFRGAGSGRLVHPNAPSGGVGPGPSRNVGMMNGAAGAVPHLGSPAGRLTDWASTLNAHEHPYNVVGMFEKRIAAAGTLPQLLAVASDIAQVRQDLVRRKAMRTPEPGDKAVKELVMSLLTESMGSLQKIAFTATAELVEAGASAATAKACAEAFSEAIDQYLEHAVGNFAKELRGAIKEGDITTILKASAAAMNGLAAGLKDGDSLTRKTMQLLKARGINVGEATVSKWIFARAESFGSILGNIVKLWTAHPLVIIARLMLTPSNVASDSEVLFLMYKDLGDKLQARMHEIAPLPQVRAVDLLKNLPPPSAPVLRAPH